MLQWLFRWGAAPKAGKAKLRGRHITELSSAEVEAVFGVAAAKAENFAAGLPVTGELDGQVVDLHEDGRIEVVETAARDGDDPKRHVA
jgi:hypothetical protein